VTISVVTLLTGGGAFYPQEGPNNSIGRYSDLVL